MAEPEINSQASETQLHEESAAGHTSEEHASEEHADATKPELDPVAAAIAASRASRGARAPHQERRARTLGRASLLLGAAAWGALLLTALNEAWHGHRGLIWGAALAAVAAVIAAALSDLPRDRSRPASRSAQTGFLLAGSALGVCVAGWGFFEVIRVVA